MREIKFRAWIEHHNEMFYDWGITSGVGEGFYRKICPETEIIKIGRGYDLPEISDWQEKIVFMQYIGLKDKNNKKIYEGDILLHNDDNWGYGGEYDKKHDGYLRTLIPSIETLLKECPDYFIDQIQLWEIIGNIYENPELLSEV